VDDTAHQGSSDPGFLGLPNQDQASLPDGGTIKLECTPTQSDSQSGAGHMQIAAIRVGAIH
jgi:hypothetical protein